MKLPKSKLGTILAALYLIAAVIYLLQSGFRGSPWSHLVVFAPSSFIVGFIGDIFLDLLLSIPYTDGYIWSLVVLGIALNALLAYWIGVGMQKAFRGELNRKTLIIIFIVLAALIILISLLFGFPPVINY